MKLYQLETEGLGEMVFVKPRQDLRNVLMARDKTTGGAAQRELRPHCEGLLLHSTPACPPGAAGATG